MTTLHLGNVDAGSLPKNKRKFLDDYHPFMSDKLKNLVQFRDESNGSWKHFEEKSGREVKRLQQFLKDAGFMPKAEVSGVFGYATAAAVRLFQHYTHFVDGYTDIGTPDGIVGQKTWDYINKWETGKICDWGAASSELPSPEFSVWLDLIKKGKEHFLNNSDPIIAQSEAFTGKTDTRKVKDWDTSPNTIHLIGIRRGEEHKKDNADNNDLFILLLNGMVFYFWGSTDPNPHLAPKKQHKDGLAFLCEGQHEYTFGWHKVSSKEKIYRALRPPKNGVLIFRDKDKNHSLSPEERILYHTPNKTINIHWSGIGSFNYSAGCQVISGQNYLTGNGTLVDCSGFAAKNYDQLGTKTRGAYDLLVDLILTYAPKGVTTISYTLAKDEAVFLSDGMTKKMLTEVIQQMKKNKSNE